MFGVLRRVDGKISRDGHLSFDPYGQDETISLGANQEGDQKRAGILFKDEPDCPLKDVLKIMAEHPEDTKVQGNQYCRVRGVARCDAGAASVLQESRPMARRRRASSMCRARPSTTGLAQRSAVPPDRTRVSLRIPGDTGIPAKLKQAANGTVGMR